MRARERRRFAKRRGGPRPRWLLLALVPAVLLVAWLVGFLLFVRAIPRDVADRETRTDAIVVLTGGADRLAAGVDLLQRGYARWLFVSGVHRGLVPADMPRIVGRSPGDMPCCIAVGYAAADTFGNALETAHWMREKGFSSVRLVTGDFHMPRALMLFRRALPDAKVIPHPVFPEGLRRVGWMFSGSVARLLVSEYHKFLLAWLFSGLVQMLPGGESG